MNESEVLNLVQPLRKPRDFVFEFYALKMLCPSLTQKQYSLRIGVTQTTMSRYMGRYKEEVLEELMERGEKFSG